jgi:hypothetical protein
MWLRDRLALAKPGRLLETGVLLDGAIDVLEHPGVVDPQRAYAVRDTVLGPAAARGGRMVERVLANRARWKVEQLEPMPLYLRDGQAVVRVDVQ